MKEISLSFLARETLTKSLQWLHLLRLYIQPRFRPCNVIFLLKTLINKISTQEDANSRRRFMIIKTRAPISIFKACNNQLRGRLENKTIMICSLQISQDSFHDTPMNISWLWHKLACLIYSIRDVKSNKCDVLKSSNHTLIQERTVIIIAIGRWKKMSS